MAESKPKTVLRSDYRVPDYLIDTVDLSFDLREDGTRVEARLGLRRRADATAEGVPLVLVGESVDLVEIEIDGAGRITIPQRLREYANLTGDVIIAGALTHVELWDRDAYQSIESELTNVMHEQFKAGGTIN